MMHSQKPFHTIVLDAGPILQNSPSVSTLIGNSEEIFSVPSIVSEIRDKTARMRFETTLKPFLSLRNPIPPSIKLVEDFARKTGDLVVLSKTDVEILALAYELECERNGSDRRLRKTPGQKHMDVSPPKRHKSRLREPRNQDRNSISESQSKGLSTKSNMNNLPGSITADCLSSPISETPLGIEDIKNLQIVDSESEENNETEYEPVEPHIEPDTQPISNLESSDSEGWIDPSNFGKHQAKLGNSASSTATEHSILQVAVLTTDFAIQNVLLQMNLNLIAPSMKRIRSIRSYVLRCHACFEITKIVDKQFCPRCGKPSLTRVSCSTNQNGKVSLYLKKNMQWNHRGDRFSIPKPVPGSASGRVGHSRGGGKGGWGHELILAEDQKEYVRAINEQHRSKDTTLLDNDSLPGFITNERKRVGGRIKIGAGRDINSKKR